MKAPRQDQQSASNPSGRRLRWAAWGLAVAMVLLMVAVIGAFGAYRHLAADLPRIDSLVDYRPPIISSVYADDGRKIGEFYTERRIVVDLDRIPQRLRQAFVAAEDSRFYQHRGIDLVGIARAFFKNLEAGTIVQGGSTITQQVTKSFLLTPERSYSRKIKEAILAYRIDRVFSKDEILYLYLNQIYLGHGAYGVAAAAENYFDKPVADLSLAECAMLAGLPQAPSRYSPFSHPERARQRQRYVLNRMVEEGMVSPAEARVAAETELEIKPRRNWFFEEVPVYTEHVRRYVIERYGEKRLLNDGLQIYTAVDTAAQKAARNEIDKGLRALDKRRGYRGPLEQLTAEGAKEWIARRSAGDRPVPGEIREAVVTAVDDRSGRVRVDLGSRAGVIQMAGMQWARPLDPVSGKAAGRLETPGQILKVNDLVQVRVEAAGQGVAPLTLALEQVPRVEGALLCLENRTGQVKAMIGGRDFAASQFNRAVQSRRQPGSAFKPIIYAAAIDKGYTPASMLIDAPIIYHDEARDFTWKPRNYGRRFHGPTSLRRALAQSRNVVTVKLLRDIGVSYVIDYARRLGITSPLAPNLSLALGSSGVSLLELVQAYSVFANRGERVAPIFVTRIVDRDGRVLEEAEDRREPVISPATAYIVTSLLESVVQEGTGQHVKALGRPVAGKTGTTDDLHDAWFMGYTPGFTTGVWVGFDDDTPLGDGETGARAASPIWLGFMQTLLQDRPVEVFTVPEGVVFAKIDAETGLLAIAESRETRFECFKEGTEPTTYSSRPEAVDEPESFFKSDI
jgi:penicillin-binding protein 1A